MIKRSLYKGLLSLLLISPIAGIEVAAAQGNSQGNGCQQSASAPDTGNQRVKRRRPGAQANTASECIMPSTPSGAVDSSQSDDSNTNVLGNNTELNNTQQREPSEQQRAALKQSRAKNSLAIPTLSDYQDSVPLPDRWRIVEALGYQERWYDPYNRNVLKADRPVFNTKDWFFNISIISDSVVELRKVPTPIGASSTADANDNDLLGDSSQLGFNQNLAFELVYYKGDTTFMPPDWEFRLTPVINYNYADIEELQGINANPRAGTTRNDEHIGFQAAFIDYHIQDVSVNYDFDSIRLGIQPYNADFRGFLFQDSPFGLRLFGTRKNNIFQYNVAWFRKLEKDTNSGLNDQGKRLRNDDIFTVNLYWQDLFKLGLFSEFSILYNRNREDAFKYDNNDFIVRPASLGTERLRDYDVTYLGYGLDGHIDRVNLTLNAYWAIGEEKGATFRDQKTAINAWFLATEASIDFDWLRLRASFLHSSGDDDPFDQTSTGFDAVFENPQFAGADTSYWIRQAVPFINGGRVALSSRNGVLPNLRSSKEQGQSNFTNPGLNLIGIGADADILPELRLSANWNYLQFDETELLNFARNQGKIGSEIGHDISVSAIYRPLQTQNIVLRGSLAKLIGGEAYDSLYLNESPYYILLNATLTY